MRRRLRIAHIVGARPQFVKMALVADAARRFPRIETVVIHTGQHYDRRMSRVFFEELALPAPRYDLGVGSGSHADQTGAMLVKLGRVLPKTAPDMVFVYGDTNSTLAGALAAVKMGIPLAHVEAGLRSFDRAMPEEINRVATDHVSDILFCPTPAAVKNLKREGITRGVWRVGDVMIDMLKRYGRKARRESSVLKRLRIGKREYYLATTHRAGNTDDVMRLKRIVRALGRLSKPVILPCHPRTRKALLRHRIRPGKNIRLIDPVPYLDMLMLEMNAAAVFTDSGGVQKEAFYFRVPCVTLRDETEWVETVEAGWNLIAGTEPACINRAERHFLRRRPPAKVAGVYGSGASAARMLVIAERFVRKGRR